MILSEKDAKEIVMNLFDEYREYGIKMKLVTDEYTGEESFLIKVESLITLAQKEFKKRLYDALKKGLDGEEDEDIK